MNCAVLVHLTGVLSRNCVSYVICQVPYQDFTRLVHHLNVDPIVSSFSLTYHGAYFFLA